MLDMDADEIAKLVDGAYKNILEKFNPCARQLISAGKAYLKSLHDSFLFFFTSPPYPSTSYIFSPSPQEVPNIKTSDREIFRVSNGVEPSSGKNGIPPRSKNRLLLELVAIWYEWNSKND
ncbi:hypothetical protein HNY73_001759 [Argiope bruennichi]|uniref:IMD domain-containing protein n=1 Tax=Argiope bruennichi TaxID=94029 RepID=A0A8T0FRB8_ARGBR|nr:hypothetical protein HNY73_001759 [Argiope bruennichi]